MKKLIGLVILSMLFTGPVFAYDKNLAKSYEKHFSEFAGKKTVKAMQMISAKSLMESQTKGDNLFILDIRTEGETAVYGFNLNNSMAISANEVFKPENLKKIPINMKVVVVCKGGIRAAMVATGLRHIGYKDAYVLKGGFAGLSSYVSPKNAYQ